MEPAAPNKQQWLVEKYSYIHFSVMYIVGAFFDNYDTMYRTSKLFPEPDYIFRYASLKSRTHGVVKFDRYYDVIEANKDVDLTKYI